MVNNSCVNSNSADGIQVYDYADITLNNCIVWGSDTSQIRQTLGTSVSISYSDIKEGWEGEGWEGEGRDGEGWEGEAREARPQGVRLREDGLEEQGLQRARAAAAGRRAARALHGRSGRRPRGARHSVPAPVELRARVL